MKDQRARQTNAQKQKREFYRCPCVDVAVRIDHWSKVPVVSVHQSLHVGVARVIVDQLHACAIHNILTSSVFNAVPEMPHTDTIDFRSNECFFSYVFQKYPACQKYSLVIGGLNWKFVHCYFLLLTVVGLSNFLKLVIMQTVLTSVIVTQFNFYIIEFFEVNPVF